MDKILRLYSIIQFDLNEIIPNGENNDMFLNLTNQEEYINPYTKEVETGSNQWRHRWINESGDVIYTNDGFYDPRTDVNLNRSSESVR